MIIILFNVKRGTTNQWLNEKWRINLDKKRMVLANVRVIPNLEGRAVQDALTSTEVSKWVQWIRSKW